MISFIRPVISAVFYASLIVPRASALPKQIEGGVAAVSSEFIGAIDSRAISALPGSVRPIIADPDALVRGVIVDRGELAISAVDTAALELLENAAVDCLILSLTPFNFSAADQSSDGTYRQTGELSYVCTPGVRVSFLLSRLQDNSVKGVGEGELVTADGIVPLRVLFEYNEVPLQHVSFESSGKVTTIPIDVHVSVAESRVVSAPGVFKFPPDMVLSPITQ